MKDRKPCKCGVFRKKAPLLGGIAAVLALAIVLSLTGSTLSISAKAVSTADYPKYQWEGRYEEMAAIDEPLDRFFTDSMTQTLAQSQGKNQTYSPINLYLALSVTAELTGGTTRQQLLDLLGEEDLDSLRLHANQVWNACYLDDKNQTLLANSLWLDKDLCYNQATMDNLAQHYYTSVYRGDFGTDGTTKAIQAWLNQQTGGLLKDSVKDVRPDPETVLAIYSTVYYQAKWTESCAFSAGENTQAPFHSPDGDVTCTYMNKKEMQTNYYWGQDFGAIALRLKDGSQMWLILPDEGKTVEDVLASGEYAQLVLTGYGNDQNSKYMKVNLSLPKFDIRATGDLKQDLQAMGVSDLFDPSAADFSPSVESQLPVWITAVNQSTRVAIDEEGVTAASYIELPAAGAAMPPEEIIDFILDRPFLFVITNRYDLPLFAGVVNEP